MNVAFFKQYYFLILQDSSKALDLELEMWRMMYVRTVSRHYGIIMVCDILTYHAVGRMSCVSSQIPPTKAASSCSLLAQHLRFCCQHTQGADSFPQACPLFGGESFASSGPFKKSPWIPKFLMIALLKSNKLESKNHDRFLKEISNLRDRFISSQADFTWEFLGGVWSWRSSGWKQNLAGET